MEGTVKFFNRIKGFGFISGDDGKDYFVHISEVPEGKFLNEGDRVTFEGMEDEKGLKAKNVQFAGEAEAPKEEAEEAPAEEEEKPAEEEAAEEEAPVEEAEEEKKEE